MLTVAILLGCALLAAQANPPDARDQFVEVAKHLRVFPPDGDYLPSSRGPLPAPGSAEYAALVAAGHPVPSLVVLLRDPDPKVRTLAAGALVAKGDARLLRQLAPLLEDQSPTFDRIVGVPDISEMPPAYGPQTVGEAALRLAERLNKSDFDRYWAVHGSLSYCADWFVWQFRHGFTQLARRQILDIPSPDREMAVLWIGDGRQRGYPGFSESELLDAARRLGRDGIVAILAHNPPGQDPDVTPHVDFTSASYLYYDSMARFLLAHAEELLRPPDSEVLLRLEEAERNRAAAREPEYGAWWPVAAASLDPPRSAGILDEAEKRYPDSMEIPLARWRIVGPQALPEILRWFWRSADAQLQLVSGITTAESRYQSTDAYKPLVEAILASPRRLQITGEAMSRIAPLAREWKTDFDGRLVEWIFAQPPDSDPASWKTPRSFAVRASGVARRLVWDPRFLNADSQLLYDIEQSLVGDLRLSRPLAVRLGELILSIDLRNPQHTPEPALQQIRSLIRQGAADLKP